MKFCQRRDVRKVRKIGEKAEELEKDYAERIEQHMDSKIFWKNFCGWVMLMSGLLVLIFLYFYFSMIISGPISKRIAASEETMLKQDTLFGALVIVDVVLLYFAVKWIWQTERLFKEDDEGLEIGNKEIR
ncbi:hypothetical protein HYT26_00830 [Candidatus Pacearchaeota archaeon]|nr:hypothetical protein [Candidatus Pacearchaeota archaeon]